MVILAFLVGLAATMATPDKYHGDEMFYTDAAMRMCQTGDYWTPYWHNGNIRLRKPILTYWTIAGSFQLFGISIFASRLPALLAGAGLLGLTFLIGRTVFKSPQIGMFAMLIIVSNVQVMQLATRATPDALLCFFVTLSMYGFARIWFKQDAGWWGPLLAFGGMGLAVQTKGLLGLTPLLANALFYIMVRPGRAGLKALWRPAAIIVGLGLAVFWYAIMVQRHGVGALREFFDDQVSAKVSTNPLFLLSNPFVYCVAVIQYFPIWTLVLVACAIVSKNELREFWRQNRRQCVFLLSLLVVAIVAFSFGNMRRSRYLTVAYPLVACALGAAIHSLTAGKAVQRWVAGTSTGVGLFLVIGGAAAIISAFWIGLRWGIGGVLLLSLGVAGVMAARREAPLWRWAVIAAVFLLCFVAYGACFRPILSPSPLPKLTRELMLIKPEPSTVFAYEVPPRVLGIIRLLSGGKLKVQPITSVSGSGGDDFPSPIVTLNPEQLRSANYTLTKIEPVIPLPLGEKFRQSTRSQGYWIGLRAPR